MRISRSFLKRILPAVFLIAFAYETKVAVSPSNYQEACAQLGITEQAKQHAVLEIFNISGYLKPKSLWEQIARSHIFEDPIATFSEATGVLYKSGAGRAPAEFSAKKASKQLFGKSMPHLWEIFRHQDSPKDVAKMILYMAQTAFAREEGVERSELGKKAWMTKWSQDYKASAAILGMIDPVRPALGQNYDKVMLLGASRPGVIARLIELINYKLNKPVLVLVGTRELWAEIDGVSPDALQLLNDAKNNNQSIDDIDAILSARPPKDSIEEGKRYLINLATKYDIKFDKKNPIIEKGGRSFLNYATKETQKLTESLMAKDLINEMGLKVEVIESSAYKSGKRADTASNASDASNFFIEEILSGKYKDKVDFNLLAVSNNPYIERQQKVVQRQFDMALKLHNLHDRYSIRVEGVGFGAKQDVATIHSEFGALIGEYFKDSFPEVDTANIFYSTRDNKSHIPDMPYNDYATENQRAKDY